MSGDRRRAHEARQMLSELHDAWTAGGPIYRLLLRRGRVKAIVRAYRDRLGLSPADLFRLVASDRRVEAPKGLIRLILDRHEALILRVIRESQTGRTVPGAVWNYLREVNEIPLSPDDDPMVLPPSSEPMVVSLLLDATALLTGGEESRTEAYISGEGEVACWKRAAKRAILLAKTVSAALAERPELRCSSSWSDVCERIVERSKRVLAVDSAEARRATRYRHAEFRTADVPGPVWVPNAYEVPFSDDRLLSPGTGGQILAEATRSTGLSNAFDEWVATPVAEAGGDEQR